MSLYFVDEHYEYVELVFGPHGHYFVYRDFKKGEDSNDPKLHYTASINNNKTTGVI